MRIVGGQVQAEVEAGRADQPQQRGESRLPLVTFISRDHRDWNPGSFGQFALAHAGLQPGELQERRRWRGQPFWDIRLCHNTIV